MAHPTRTSVLCSCIAISILIFYRELYALRDWNGTASYYTDEGDALPAAEDPSFVPKNKSIFFHQTSFHGELTPRQACSVEAAARAHPKREVYVLFSAPVTHHVLKTSCLAKLLQFNNVKFFRVHIAEYSKGTIVHSILLNDLKESKYPIQHLADILKMLTFNKWGGICLETDMIVMKSLESLPPNWIVKHNEKFIASGIMAFAKDDVGRNITSNILKEIYAKYNPTDWSITGRKAIQKVVRRMCHTIINSDYCKGLALLSYDIFYTIHNILWKIYFSRNIEVTYSFQMWNLSSRQRNVGHAPYELLAQKFCPTIFRMYGHQLGL